GAENADGLAGNFIAEKRQVRMPVAPLVFSDQMLGAPKFAGEGSKGEEGELRSGLSENVSGVGEWDLVPVGVGAIDVVESHRVLRHNLEGAFARLENLSVNFVAQGGDEAVNTAAHFFDDQASWRRLRIGIDLQLITALAQAIEGSIANVGGGEDTEFFRCHASPQMR